MKLLALIQCLLVVTRSLTTRPSIPSGFAVVARSVLPAASPAAPVVQHLLTLWPERFATVSAGQHSPRPHLCAPHRLRTSSAPPLHPFPTQHDLPKSESKREHAAFVGLGPPPNNLVAEKPSRDYTPPCYITMLFTDLGVLTPSAVSDELIKLFD